MNKDTKILTLVTVILVSSILAVFMAAYVINLQQFQNILPFGRQQPQFVFVDFQLFNVIRLVFSTINIVLLTVLVLTYVSIYLKTRSGFTIGLLIFAAAFLVKEIASNPMVPGNQMWPGVGQFTLWLIVLPGLLELIALSVLLYLSVKY